MLRAGVDERQNQWRIHAMKIANMFAMAIFVVSSLPSIARQTGTANQQGTTTSPAATQGNGSAAANPSANPAAAPQSISAGTPAAATASTVTPEMRPVNGELVSKLDSKSARTGDSVVVKTVQAVKTADGTEIPKGSKLVGHVTAVQAHSQANENSEMAIQFDHAELKGGQSVPIQSVIKSVSPPAGDTSTSVPDMMSAPTGAAAGGGGGMSGSRSNSASAGVASPTVAQLNAGMGSPNTPAAGTVVGKSGDDPIRTTAIPGVFLASHEPGQSPEGASTSSGTLFAAKSDIHLDGGTQMALEVSAAAAR
jgi:hypothetical protein